MLLVIQEMQKRCIIVIIVGNGSFACLACFTAAALPAVMLALEPPAPHCVHAVLSPQLRARALFLSGTPGCPAVRSPRNAAAARATCIAQWVPRGSRLVCGRLPLRSRPRGERVDCPQPAHTSASATAAPCPGDAAVQRPAPRPGCQLAAASKWIYSDISERNRDLLFNSSVRPSGYSSVRPTRW